MGEFTIQTLKKVVKDDMGRAIKYYSLLSVWNNLGLTKRNIQLLAYTAVRGTISSSSAKKEFSIKYNSSSATVNNMISDLSAAYLLVKDKGKYRVNPKIDLDFSQDLLIGFKLLNPPIEGE